MSHSDRREVWLVQNGSMEYFGNGWSGQIGFGHLNQVICKHVISLSSNLKRNHNQYWSSKFSYNLHLLRVKIRLLFVLGVAWLDWSRSRSGHLMPFSFRNLRPHRLSYGTDARYQIQEMQALTSQFHQNNTGEIQLFEQRR